MTLETVRLSDIGRVVTGKTPPTKNPEYYGEDYPFITPTDITDNTPAVAPARYISELGREKHHNALLPPQSVCYTCIASVGKMCMTSRPSLTNQQINSIIVDKTRFDPRYVYYRLRVETPHIVGIASGVATPIINKSMFSDVELTVHPLPTQKKIASILSAYDDLIENNERRIKILEEMARAIYREWFTYPFHGVTGTPSCKDAPSPALRHPLPVGEGRGEGSGIRLINSPLGKIPEGWEVTEFRNIFEIKYGKTLPKTKITEVGPYPVYGAGDVIGYYDRVLCQEKCALVTSRGNGSGTVWRTREAAFVTNNSLIILPKVKFKHWDYSFVELLLKHSNVMEAKTGSAQPQVTIENLNYVKAIVPEKPCVEKFCSFVTPISEQVDLLFKKSSNLRQTRDLLLPRLISGELDVEELDIKITE